MEDAEQASSNKEKRINADIHPGEARLLFYYGGTIKEQFVLMLLLSLLGTTFLDCFYIFSCWT